uniref:Uncharacterized protein n=1 Tax=Anguilla anguilla TaxID=7936 RepID=A0A0E9X9Q9_ANGAN
MAQCEYCFALVCDCTDSPFGEFQDNVFIVFGEVAANTHISPDYSSILILNQDLPVDIVMCFQAIDNH